MVLSTGVVKITAYVMYRWFYIAWYHVECVACKKNSMAAFCRNETVLNLIIHQLHELTFVSSFKWNQFLFKVKLTVINFLPKLLTKFLLFILRYLYLFLIWEFRVSIFIDLLQLLLQYIILKYSLCYNFNLMFSKITRIDKRHCHQLSSYCHFWHL